MAKKIAGACRSPLAAGDLPLSALMKPRRETIEAQLSEVIDASRTEARAAKATAKSAKESEASSPIMRTFYCPNKECEGLDVDHLDKPGHSPPLCGQCDSKMYRRRTRSARQSINSSSAVDASSDQPPADACATVATASPAVAASPSSAATSETSAESAVTDSRSEHRVLPEPPAKLRRSGEPGNGHLSSISRSKHRRVRQKAPPSAGNPQDSTSVSPDSPPRNPESLPQPQEPPRRRAASQPLVGRKKKLRTSEEYQDHLRNLPAVPVLHKPSDVPNDASPVAEETRHAGESTPSTDAEIFATPTVVAQVLTADNENKDDDPAGNEEVQFWNDLDDMTFDPFPSGDVESAMMQQTRDIDFDSEDDKPLPQLISDADVDVLEAAEAKDVLKAAEAKDAAKSSAPTGQGNSSGAKNYNPDDTAQFSTAMCHRILSYFQHEDLHLLSRYVLALGPRTIGTACSGSDNIVEWLQWVSPLIGAGTRLTMHSFACDNDAHVRAYLRHRFPHLDLCFSDIKGATVR